MSFYEEKKGNAIQEFLQIGRDQRFYLRNKKNPETVNIENILAAIDAIKVKYVDSFNEKENYLLSMLPPKDRDQYISKQIEQLRQSEKQRISSLSDPMLKRQYQGDRTKGRQPRQKVPIQVQAQNLDEELDSLISNMVLQSGNKMTVFQHIAEKLDIPKKDMDEYLKARKT